MKIVFFGTPDYVIPILETLHKKFKSRAEKSPIVAVVTQAPKLVGRKKVLSYSPVDKWAYEKGITKYSKAVDLLQDPVLRANHDRVLGILAAYGEILSKEVIDFFPKGIINLHPSLLPKFRGASPVQATILFEEKDTGLTFVKIDASLDKGQFISKLKEEVKDSDTAGSLRERLFSRASEVLPSLLNAFMAGKIKPKQLSHYPGTFTWEIKKEDAFIPPQYLIYALNGENIEDEWRIPFINNFSIQPTSRLLERFIRSMQPWPVAWTLLRLSLSGQTKRLKILKAHLEEPVPNTHHLVPDLVQLEGKDPVTWRQFLEGYPNCILE